MPLFIAVLAVFGCFSAIFHIIAKTNTLCALMWVPKVPLHLSVITIHSPVE